VPARGLRDYKVVAMILRDPVVPTDQDDEAAN
jgi:hypothetical protein